jgi:thioredoxin-like negative regulator of GroEL
MQCLAAKPIVDGIEKDLEGRARVVRLNVSDPQGRDIAMQYAVRSLPTTIVVGGDGEVIDLHAGIPSRKKVVAQAIGT